MAKKTNDKPFVAGKGNPNTELNIASRWNENLPASRKALAETTQANLEALRAAKTDFGLAISISNHRDLKSKVQQFYEVRLETMMATMKFILQSVKDGYIDTVDKISGCPVRRMMDISDYVDFHDLQCSLEEEMTQALGLPRGNISMDNLMGFNQEGGGAPTSPVNISVGWNNPVEKSQIQGGEVEVLGEVIPG